jgi:hypothetical protein
LQPLLKDKLAELTAKYGSGSKLVLHASEDEDGGSSDMDMDFGGVDDDDGAAKRKGPKPAAKAAAAKGKKGGWVRVLVWETADTGVCRLIFYFFRCV